MGGKNSLLRFQTSHYCPVFVTSRDPSIGFFFSPPWSGFNKTLQKKNGPVLLLSRGKASSRPVWKARPWMNDTTSQCRSHGLLTKGLNKKSRLINLLRWSEGDFSRRDGCLVFFQKGGLQSRWTEGFLGESKVSGGALELHYVDLGLFLKKMVFQYF